MSAGDVPNPPAPTSPPAPGNRFSAAFVVAVVVAVLMLLGVGGLVAAALLGDDDEPTGAGLRPQVDVEAPATAPSPDDSHDAEPAPTVTDDDAAEATGEADSAATVPAGDDDFSDEPTITTVAGVDDIEPPSTDDLPEPGDEPVVLPVQVTTPPPPSTFPAVAFADVGPGAIAALDGWSVHDRSTDHVAFVRDDQVVEVFTVADAATADLALEWFYDDVRPELEELTTSPITRLGAPSARFWSVAGHEYVATTARQQATSTMSGSIVAAVRPDGSGVVLATSRSGESSPDELVADADLLAAILAHL